MPVLKRLQALVGYLCPCKRALLLPGSLFQLVLELCTEMQLVAAGEMGLGQHLPPLDFSLATACTLTVTLH